MAHHLLLKYTRSNGKIHSVPWLKLTSCIHGYFVRQSSHTSVQTRLSHLDLKVAPLSHAFPSRAVVLRYIAVGSIT